MIEVFKMSDPVSEYDGEEWCPYCDKYIAYKCGWNEPHLETKCPECGHKMMICTMCEDCAHGFCDWSKENGCHMDIAHMNKNNKEEE